MASNPVGELIKLARRRKGWDQTELARRVGKSVSTVKNWERGRSSPVRALPLLEDVLGADLGTGTFRGTAGHGPAALAPRWALDLTDLEAPDLTPLERKLIEHAAFLAAAEKRAELSGARQGR